MNQKLTIGLAGVLAGAVAYWVFDNYVGDMSSEPAATAESAAEWVAKSEAEMDELRKHVGHVFWVQANFVNHDTTQLAAKAGEEATAFGVRLANEAKRWNGVDLPPDLRRKIDKIKLGLTLPAPDNAADTRELAEITARLDSTYATGKYCRIGKDGGEECLSDVQIIQIMATHWAR